MDIVYTHRFDPRSGNKQLIYSLRSAEKYLKGYGNIYVIGHAPELFNVLHIEATDLKSAAVNIKDKLLMAINEPLISENFLYMADDHYLLSEQKANEYPVYSCGTLQTLATVQRNSYKQHILNTLDALQKRDYNTLNYNIHSPIIYNKKLLVEAIEQYEWNSLGYVMKSIYGNTNNIPSVELPDLKLSSNRGIPEMKSLISGRPVFSTGKEWTQPNLKQFMDELYPEKSKYE